MQSFAEWLWSLMTNDGRKSHESFPQPSTHDSKKVEQKAESKHEVSSDELTQTISKLLAKEGEPIDFLMKFKALLAYANDDGSGLDILFSFRALTGKMLSQWNARCFYPVHLKRAREMARMTEERVYDARIAIERSIGEILYACFPPKLVVCLILTYDTRVLPVGFVLPPWDPCDSFPHRFNLLCPVCASCVLDTR